MLLPRPAVAALAQGDEWLPAGATRPCASSCSPRPPRRARPSSTFEIAYAGDGLTRVLVSVDRASFAQGADASSMKESLSAALNAWAPTPRLIASADRVEIAPVLR